MKKNKYYFIIILFYNSLNSASLDEDDILLEFSDISINKNSSSSMDIFQNEEDAISNISFRLSSDEESCCDNISITSLEESSLETLSSFLSHISSNDISNEQLLDFKCSLCPNKHGVEDIKLLCKTNCSTQHIFCIKCITNYIETENNSACPICREQLYSPINMIVQCFNERTDINKTGQLTTSLEIDIDRLLSVLSSGIDINARYFYGGTILDFIIEKYPPEIVKIFLDHGAAVNVKNRNGLTPLMSAVVNNNYEVAKILIEHGANVNFKNTFISSKSLFETPLMNATYNNNIKIMRLLINNGAEINAQAETTKLTALNIAMVCKYQEAIDLLILHGAELQKYLTTIF